MASVPLEGSSVFIVGRFERLPKSRIERELAGHGATLHHRLTRKTGYAVITHAAAGRPLSVREPTRCLSEDTFLRMLGLLPALQGKDIEPQRFLGLCGLGPDEVRLLTVFDVLQPADEKFGFADLKIAQHIADLRRRGADLDAVLMAATELRRRRRGTTAADITRLDIAPS